MSACALVQAANYSTRVTCCDEILQRKDTQILNYVYQVFNICFFLKHSRTTEKRTMKSRIVATVRMHLVLA